MDRIHLTGQLPDAWREALAARLSTAMEKMSAFASGAADDIPELTEPSLICKRRPDNSISFTNIMAEIATPGQIDF